MWIFSWPVCWIILIYYREKLLVNHFSLGVKGWTVTILPPGVIEKKYLLIILNKKIFKIKGDGKKGNYKFGDIVWFDTKFLRPIWQCMYGVQCRELIFWSSLLGVKGYQMVGAFNSLKDLACRPSLHHYVVQARLTLPLSTQEYKLLIYYWSGEFNQTCGEISGILPWTGVSNSGSVSCNIPLYGMIRTLNGTLYFSNHFFVAIKQHNLFFSHRLKKVPDVIFATTEPPVESPIVGRGCLLQAR